MNFIKKFNIIANKAKIAFAKRDYKEILNGVEVKEIYVESLPIVPTQTIINKLLKNETLEQNEIDKVQNILYNFGFSMELQIYFLNNFEYNKLMDYCQQSYIYLIDLQQLYKLHQLRLQNQFEGCILKL